MISHEEYSDAEIAKAVGETLQALRKERNNMSQSAVYLASNIERNVYQKYDSGKVSSPKFANLIRIAETMGITPGHILDRAYEYLKQKK